MKTNLFYYLSLFLIFSYVSVLSEEITPKVTVEVRNEWSNLKTVNTLWPQIRIYNNSDKPLDMSKISFRYYYTIDEVENQNFYCDWASVGRHNVYHNFKKIEKPFDERADHYMEISFSDNTSQIAPNQYAEIHTRVTKNNWVNFNRSNDYSFNYESAYFTKSEMVAVFYNNGFIYGKPAENSISLIEPLNLEHVVTDPSTGAEYVQDQILISFKDEIEREEAEQIIASFGGEVVGFISGLNDYQVRFSGDMSLEELKTLKDNLLNHQSVSTTMLNMVLEDPNQMTPNDPHWSANGGEKYSRWEPRTWNEGDPNGTEWHLEKIKALSAWNYAHYMKPIKIGICEMNGAKINHEDLQIPTANINHIGAPNPKSFGTNYRYMQHATRVAGLVGAIQNNGRGVTGVVPKRELYMAVPRGSVNSITYVKKLQIYELKVALAWMINEGCKVINFSMGFNHRSVSPDSRNSNHVKTFINDQRDYWTPFLKKLIDRNYDFLIVQSAGNDKIDAKWNGLFCSVTDPEIKKHILIVGAISRKSSVLSGYTSYKFEFNYGSIIDIVAPGGSVTSTDSYPNQYINKISGTSYASPIVAGAAALTWSVKHELTGPQIKNIIVGTANEPVVYKNRRYDVVNALKAVQIALNEHPTQTIPPKKSGMLSGRVINAVDKRPVSDVGISIFDKDLKFYASAFTQDDGSYELILEPGTYTAVFFLDSKEPITQEITITEGMNEINVELPMVPQSDLPGIVSGYTKNKSNNLAVSGVQLNIRKGVNTKTGAIYKTIYSEAGTGYYTISLPAGNYTVEVIKENYKTDFIYIVAIGGMEIDNQDLKIESTIQDNTIRVVLSWNLLGYINPLNPAIPQDLDFHVTGGIESVGRFQVYDEEPIFYVGDKKAAEYTGATGSTDVTIRPPHVLTVYPEARNNQDGPLKFYVHTRTYGDHTSNTFGAGALGKSQATVKLYIGGEFKGLFNVPNQKGTLWKIFEIDKDSNVNVNNSMHYISNFRIPGLEYITEF